MIDLCMTCRRMATWEERGEAMEGNEGSCPALIASIQDAYKRFYPNRMRIQLNSEPLEV